jgi:hypothetical protein
LPNERLTEAIVRKSLDGAGPGVTVEEQITTDPTLARALRAASKQGGGSGHPEFVVRLEQYPNTVILYECKASESQHISPRLLAGGDSTDSDIKAYAVDGSLHYARHVAKFRNVICIAASGQRRETLRVSAYCWTKGSAEAKPLLDRAGTQVTRLLSPEELVGLSQYDPTMMKRSVDELLALSRLIHNYLRDYAKVTEAEKPLVISAVLLALQHAPFLASWDVTSDADLPRALYEAVERSMGSAIPDANRRELMLAAYQFLLTHPELNRPVAMKVKGRPYVTTSPLRFLIGDLATNVLPFAQTYTHVDVIGAFYAEFLRYTGGDGKGLGIVLTPRHLTELFVAVAEIGINDTVLDPCAGTGGFLIAAMAELDRQIGDDAQGRLRVRERQLIGIEQQPAMYALGVSNMILRGDGKANFHRGSCFDLALQAEIRRGSQDVSAPTKGLLNPPYSQKGEEQHELDFVKSMMDMLAPGGIGVAVVPMSCAIAPDPARDRLLAAHTLVATMSLPDELFYPVGAIPVAIVLRAHQPHIAARAPTWFGYWKDDGFIKVKHVGRVDADGRWPAIREGWLADYYKRAEVPGRCVSRVVSAADEWCAEAYMETDYSTLEESDFALVVREHALFALTGGSDVDDADPAERKE